MTMRDDDVLALAVRLCGEGRRVALVTVVRTAGSTPRKAGAKMVVTGDGETHGTVGGGKIEEDLVAEARAALAAGEPRLVRRHLTRDLAMCCGGEVEAFVEPMGATERLVIVGAGHVGAALARAAARLGFEIVVADEEEGAASRERFPDGARLVHSFDPRDFGVSLADDAFVVVATRDHAVDQKVLERLAEMGARPAYLGVIGSRAKIERFRRRLQARGVPLDWIERLRGPIGLDVGAETPEEIAVAVAAELIAVRRRGVTPKLATSRNDSASGTK